MEVWKTLIGNSWLVQRVILCHVNKRHDEHGWSLPCKGSRKIELILTQAKKKWIRYFYQLEKIRQQKKCNFYDRISEKKNRTRFCSHRNWLRAKNPFNSIREITVDIFWIFFYSQRDKWTIFKGCYHRNNGKYIFDTPEKISEVVKSCYVVVLKFQSLLYQAWENIVPEDESTDPSYSQELFSPPPPSQPPQETPNVLSCRMISFFLLFSTQVRGKSESECYGKRVDSIRWARALRRNLVGIAWRFFYKGKSKSALLSSKPADSQPLSVYKKSMMPRRLHLRSYFLEIVDQTWENIKSNKNKINNQRIENNEKDFGCCWKYK